ncbi:MAG: alanine--tRNA ligase, partial [Gammaproteobacteria bacterium]
MKSADIREKFLAFFESRGHARVPSSSLVPGDDPTLLFTNSGMAQFKDVFLGFDKRPYKTACTAQRCLRAGGKHNDLENVGHTARHHTFFEMLGNFSFGDYFKEKAIPMAWEFLTSPQYLGLPREHLWVTVFGGGDLFGDNKAIPADEEAAALWHKTLTGAGFSAQEAKARIIRINNADNFWMMGDTGPCGPCSEIFYDVDAHSKTFRGADEKYADVCVEVWNLVFMQFNRGANGDLVKLPKPCVDTGMGLERISAVMQGVPGNFDTDSFVALLGFVRAAVGDAGGDKKAKTEASHRVIADHIRAAAYLINDGVLPSNEGRGYVLRRIIRRALRHGWQLGARDAFFYKLAAPLPEIMTDAALNEKCGHIAEVLRREEDGFSRMLAAGMELLKSETANLPRGEKLPGAAAFKLFDTFGFPPDLTEDILRADGLSIDREGFDKCMKMQRERSRAVMKFKSGAAAPVYDGAASDFVGYDILRADATICALFVGDAAVEEVADGDNAIIVLDRTPFYAESGGQIGDAGIIRKAGDDNSIAKVRDTQKIRADVWGHLAEVRGAMRVGDMVVCEVDTRRRNNCSRNHSAAHLMHAALRRILGGHVQQRGSLVSDGHLRFDFSHDAAVRPAQLQDIALMINERVRANTKTIIEQLPYKEATGRGAMALFGEKYGDIVRTVTMDADYSVELCGGTHV